MAKYKKPRRANDPLKMVLQELKYTLTQIELEAARNNGKNAFTKDYHAGYTDGLKHAISSVNIEIGIRQNPPNINYPGERQK
jgi:hypothetical protein